jgi:hypothetical protein
LGKRKNRQGTGFISSLPVYLFPASHYYMPDVWAELGKELLPVPRICGGNIGAASFFYFMGPACFCGIAGG